MLSLCLVCDAPDVERAVRAGCPPPHRIETFSREDLVDRQHTLSEYGHGIVQAASDADAVLVDWEFEAAPAINTLCFHIRRSLRAPVLMLCRGDQDVQVAAIAAGADDALPLPVTASLLQAKVLSYRRLVQAAQQAGEGQGKAASRPHVVRHFGSLRLDQTAHRFFIGETEVELTPREFALLAFFLEHAGALCRRDQILDQVWGINFDIGTNMVDVYTYFLRRKLEAHGLKDMIQTVRGQGYRLVLPT